jgi:hypothetical protein
MKAWVIVSVLLIISIVVIIGIIYFWKVPSQAASIQNIGVKMYNSILSNAETMQSVSRTYETLDNGGTVNVHFDKPVYIDGERIDGQTIFYSSKCEVKSDGITDAYCIREEGKLKAIIKVIDEKEFNTEIPIKIEYPEIKLSNGTITDNARIVTLPVINAKDDKALTTIDVTDLGKGTLHIGETSTTVTIVAMVQDGDLRKTETDNTITLEDTGVTSEVYYPLTNPTYNYRSFFLFNISTIPTGYSVTSTVLNLSCNQNTSVNVRNVSLYNVETYPMTASINSYQDTANGTRFAFKIDLFPQNNTWKSANLGSLASSIINLNKIGIAGAPFGVGVVQTVSAGDQELREGSFINTAESALDPQLIVTYTDLDSPTFSNLNSNESIAYATKYINLSGTISDAGAGLSEVHFEHDFSFNQNMNITSMEKGIVSSSQGFGNSQMRMQTITCPNGYVINNNTFHFKRATSTTLYDNVTVTIVKGFSSSASGIFALPVVANFTILRNNIPNTRYQKNQSSVFEGFTCDGGIYSVIIYSLYSRSNVTYDIPYYVGTLNYTEGSHYRLSNYTLGWVSQNNDLMFIFFGGNFNWTNETSQTFAGEKQTNTSQTVQVPTPSLDARNWRICGNDTANNIGCSLMQKQIIAPLGVTFTLDTTYPTGSITAPSNGSRVNGIVSLYASLTDDETVKSYWQYNSTTANVWTNLSTGYIYEPFTLSWDTRTYSNGAKDVRVVAIDESGNVNLTIPYKTYIVDNGVPYMITPPNTTYPNAQSSAKNTQVVSIRINISDYDSGIVPPYLNPFYLNGTNANNQMANVTGGYGANEWAMFNINITINAATQIEQIADLLMPDQNWLNGTGTALINIDNDVPIFSDLQCTNISTGEISSCLVSITDNYKINGTFKFAINASESWINTSLLRTGSSDTNDVLSNSTIYSNTAGEHSVYFWARDDAGNEVQSDIINFLVTGASTPLVIVYNEPPSDVVITTRNVTFNYTVTGADGYGCKLSVNDVLNLTASGLFNEDSQYLFHQNFSNGDHTWIVECNDSNNVWYEGGLGSFNISYDEYAPEVIFNEQLPADLNLPTFLGMAGVNITYNITDVGLSGLNTNDNGIQLFYKANSTASNVMFYVNGSSYSGYFNKGNYTNVSEQFTWNLFDNNVLPASYNYLERTIETVPHSADTLTGANQYTSIQLLNISNSSQYGWWEIMANSTAVAGALRIYYCNETYAHTNSPVGNPNCNQFGTLSATTTFNHEHSAYSKHQVIPFAINTTTGMIGNIEVTSNSYFILRGATTGNWYIYNTTIPSTRSNEFRKSTNNGLAWTEKMMIVDSHSHQFTLNSTYGGTNSLWYYACANDTNNNQNCTEPRQDLFEVGGLAPSSPDVYSPTNTTYNVASNIEINWTASASPNGYAITNYNVTLYNASGDFNKVLDNTLNLNSNWSVGMEAGSYYIEVQANDSLNQIARGISEIFAIVSDTTKPYFTLIPTSPNLNITNSSYLAVRFNATDAIAFNTFAVNDTTNFEINITGGLINITSLSVGVYFLNISINDTSNNLNSTIWNFNVSEYIFIDNAPTFTNCRNFTAYNITAFSQTISASDDVGINSYWLNDTTYFYIPLVTSGNIKNNSDMTSLIGMHYLNLSVNDTANQFANCYFRINISAYVPATPTGGNVTQCNYKKFGYWNKYLPWFREVNCI